jgi:hypothetical protein
MSMATRWRPGWAATPSPFRACVRRGRDGTVSRTQLVVIAYETGLVTPGAPPSR